MLNLGGVLALIDLDASGVLSNSCLLVDLRGHDGLLKHLDLLLEL